MPIKILRSLSLRENNKVYAIALTVGVSSLLFQVAGLQNTLRFSRNDIFAGEWWRLLTGNLVHLGYSHLLLNLAGLAVIVFLLAPAMSSRHWLFTGLVSMLGVGCGLLIGDPQIIWYVGLSGALYGLLFGGAIALFRDDKLMSVLIGGYALGKIIWEQLHGPVKSSELIAGGNVIVNAHLYGLIAGGTASLALLAISHSLRQSKS